MNAVVGLTDQRWFEFLSSESLNGSLDEVNFWRPRSQDRFLQLDPGEPFFLRLKHPINSIAGYGFFATWHLLPLALAWDLFGEKNGVPTYPEFIDRIRGFRSSNAEVLGPRALPLGCIVLRDLHFLPRNEWIAWTDTEEWSKNIVVGKRYDLSKGPGVQLMELLSGRQQYVAPEFSTSFVPLVVDERRRTEAISVEREGQGSFRLRVLDAYSKRCAVTGERTVPVLHAAHIQPYLGPASNNLRNGIVLRSDLHELYDRGYIAVTPEYKIEVSNRIREEFENGRDYYALHGRGLKVLPVAEEKRPSLEVLQWHCEEVYEKFYRVA